MGVGEEEKVQIPKNLLERQRKHQGRFRKLSPQERKAWGITESSVKAQQRTDEKKNPSK